MAPRAPWSARRSPPRWFWASLLARRRPGARGAKEVPFLAARVNDLANLVPPEVRERLETKLADLERARAPRSRSSPSTAWTGDSVEDYAVRVFQTWKLGRKDVDDGVLFVVARQERRMRIEVGYGLEGRLTDARSRQILDDIVRPHLPLGKLRRRHRGRRRRHRRRSSRGAPLPAPKTRPHGAAARLDRRDRGLLADVPHS